MADVTRRIAERVDIPIFVDADSGFGNIYNVYRTIRTLELAGAQAIQIEDQVPIKQARDIKKRPLVETTEMVAKLKAALDARRNDSLMISARTDAAVNKDLADALDRAALYAEVGADLVFVEGLSDPQHRRELIRRLNDGCPTLFNLAWPSSSAAPSPSTLRDEGYALALHPTAVIGAIQRSTYMALSELSSTANNSDTAPSFEEFLETVAFLDSYSADT